MKKISASLLALAFVVSPAAFGTENGIMLQNLMPNESISAVLNWQRPLYASSFRPNVLAQENSYPTHFSERQDYTRGDRHLDGVGLEGAEIGKQELAIAAPRKVYTKAFHKVFLAKAGDTLTPTFDYKGTWMNGYVFLDLDNDGDFNYQLGENNSTVGTDVMAFSHYQGKNSAGEANNGQYLTTPAFTLPDHLTPGIYRLRYKVDWDNIDPAGSTVAGNDLLKNGGAICDVLLNVHGDKCKVTVAHADGSLTAADGSPLAGEYAFGESLKVKVNVAEGKIFRGIRVRHGYHLEGEQTDQNGNPQYQVEVFSADQLAKSDYRLPATCLDGEVELEALVADQNEDYFTNVLEGQDYDNTVNRHLDGIGWVSGDGSQHFDIAVPRKVYTKALSQSFQAKAGEKVTATFDFSTDWMNGYVYIDRDNNGQFGQNLGEELMAYSHLDGKDSEGNKANGGQVNPPAFTIPANMAPGIYRMRYKVDWNNSDPAGSTAEGNDIMKNGGALCDILLNVHGDSCPVTVVPAANGTILDAEAHELNGTDKAFGRELKVKVDAVPGFFCQKITVRHGYHLDGERLVHGNPQYQDVEFPAYLIRDGLLTIPAKYMDGEVRISGEFVKDSGVVPGGKDYALSFEASTERNHPQRVLRKITFEAEQGGQTILEIPESAATVYQKMLSKEVSVVPGDEVQLTTDFVGSGVHYYLYLDLNEDGQLRTDLGPDGRPTTSSELVSYTYYNGHNSEGTEISDPDAVATDGLPTFRIPENLPEGNYRARLKVDVDDVEASGSERIAVEGGYVVDFLLNVHGTSYPLELVTENGNLYGEDNTGLPMSVTPFQRSMSVVPMPVAEGYVADKMLVKHGHRLDGPQYVHGNRQWGVYEVPATAYTLPKDSINGDVEISVKYVKGADATYDLVFFDEFNGADGTQPDSTKWVRCQHENNSAWNRWVSQSEDVVYLKEGKLVTRAIKNPEKTPQNPGDMITGGVETRGIFTWESGKIECRAKANLHTGTFPAIWMMPENQDAGWPKDGEIDIFEAINNDSKAYHTIHTNWTYNLHKGGNGSNVPLSHDRYHTYGLEWTPSQLKFFVDGKHVWTYSKSKNQSDLDQGQWPFSRNFYLILNQSVGNGSWASNPDINHTYEFLIDWIRVYQTPVNRSKSDLQTALYRVTKCKESAEVNGYTIDHPVVNAAKKVFSRSRNVEELNRATAEVKAATKINQPELNRFYRLRSAYQVGAADDMKYLQSTQTADGKQNMVAGAQGKGVEATFLYTDQGILSYTTGQYCGGESLMAVGAQAPALFEEAKNGKLGQYNIKLGNQYIYGADATLKYGTPNAHNGYNWWLEPVNSLQVQFQGNGESGYYATLYSPVALTLPAGVKAYVGKNEGNVLTLTEISGVPANQGVLLLAASEGTKTFTQTKKEVAVPAENDFVGQYATLSKPSGEDFYELSYGTDSANAEKVGFYVMDQLDTLKGFRARVKKDGMNTANELRMNFGDPTGIASPEQDASDHAVFYDLSGRRVSVPEKGIYIVNGKKVIIK